MPPLWQYLFAAAKRQTSPLLPPKGRIPDRVPCKSASGPRPGAMMAITDPYARHPAGAALPALSLGEGHAPVVTGLLASAKESWD